MQRSSNFQTIRYCSKKSELNFIDQQYFASTENVKLDSNLQENKKAEEDQKPADILDSNSEENFFDEHYFRGQTPVISETENRHHQTSKPITE